MSQTNVDYSDNPTGPELMDDYLDKDQENRSTTNSGIQRPTYAKAGTFWINNSANPWVLYFYNGSTDVAIGTIGTGSSGAFNVEGVDLSNYVDLTSNQTIGGNKGFQNITIGDTSEYKVSLYKTSGGDLGIAMYNQNNSAWMSSIVINNDGSINLQPSTSITAPTPATSDNSTKIATTAHVKAQGYITTTTKTVADSGCTFVLSNGFKVITETHQFTANTDYSWSYGTTFSNTPTILIGRKTGATSTVTAYTPWVRGDVGKSSSTIYATTGGTYMLMAIGN